MKIPCPKCGSTDTFISPDCDHNIWLYCNKCGYDEIIIEGKKD
jgi:ribosomal protein S27AE